MRASQDCGCIAVTDLSGQAVHLYDLAGRTRGQAAKVVFGMLWIARVLLAALLLAAGATLLGPAAPAGAAPAVGQVEEFWVTDWGTGKVVQIPAVLRSVGEHCLVYVQQGRTVYDGAMSALVGGFDTVTYPTLVSLMGSEPNPGIDAEPRVVLLVYPFNRNGFFGYFYPGDIDPQNWPGASNRRELISLDLSTVVYDQDKATATAAHELAHMICYYRDYMLDSSPAKTREAVWLEEGIAMYAEAAIGQVAGTGPEVQSFAANPNKQLTRWEGGFLSDYGAGLVFVSHVVECLGAGALRSLLDEPLDGIAGINKVLASEGSGRTFEDLFRTFVLANYLDVRVGSDPPFGHRLLDVFSASTALLGLQPVVGVRSVPVHGAVYLELGETSADATVGVVLDGQDGSPLRAALVSWDPAAGGGSFAIRDVVLDPLTAGGAAVSEPGWRRHALVVWGLGPEGSTASYEFRYSFGPLDEGVPLFLDVGGGHIFAPFVRDLAARSVVSGSQIPDGSGLWYFRPSEDVRRAQFAKMVVEAVGMHTPEIDATVTPTYRDVKLTMDGSGNPDPYPFDYVEEAAAAGIVRGYSDGLFGPWESITRIQLVRMILRAAAAAGWSLGAYEGPPVFADVTPASSLYADVMTAYAAGITAGSQGSDGRLYFRPWEHATRGQVSKMLSQLLSAIPSGQ